MQIVAVPVTIGPFFTGNTAPDVEGFLTWDVGGYVDLTGVTVQFVVRKWDPMRHRAFGDVVTGGDCTLGNPAAGEAIYSWTTAPLPVDVGWYAGRFVVTFPDGSVQDSQDCVFEMQVGSPVVAGLVVVVDHADASPKTLLPANLTDDRVVIVQATAIQAAVGGPEFDVGYATDTDALFDDLGAGAWLLSAVYTGVCLLPATRALVCTVVAPGTAGTFSMKITVLPLPP